jgi:hypothetical protein
MQQTVLWLQTWTAAIVLLVLAATFIVGLVLRTTADRIPPICNKLVADECVSLTRARTRLWRLQRSGKTEQRDGSGQSSVGPGRQSKEAIRLT